MILNDTKITLLPSASCKLQIFTFSSTDDNFTVNCNICGLNCKYDSLTFADQGKQFRLMTNKPSTKENISQLGRPLSFSSV